MNRAVLARDGHVGRFEEQYAAVWQHSAAGDFAGLFRLCQHAVTRMARQNRGSIINIASIYGVVSNDPTIYTGTNNYSSCPVTTSSKPA